MLAWILIQGAPMVLLDGALITEGGCATISDASGNLLFYTDGITVYNRNHSIMGMEFSSPLPNPFLSWSQTITVNVVNPLNTTCYAAASFDFIVNALPEFSVETPLIVCSSDPTFMVVLDPMESDTTESYDYEWVMRMARCFPMIL